MKPGREEEFVQAWLGLAEWTKEAFPQARATLLRDREEPNRFVSFGPWESLEAASAWRGAPEFAEGVAKIRETLDGFEPRTLDVAAEVG